MKYDQLIVWQKSMDLVLDTYSITKSFPDYEKFGLTSQMRRSSVSIPSNIAEGHGRKLTNIYANHLSIAFGSLMEFETHLHIAFKLGYINQEHITQVLKKTNEIGKMICGLKNALKSCNKKKVEILDKDFILNPQS